MNRKGFSPIIISLAVVIILAIGSYFYISLRNLVPGPSVASQIASSTTTTSSTIKQSNQCGTDINSFADIPPLPVGFQWSGPASTTNPDTVVIDHNFHLPVLKGEVWLATSTATDDVFLSASRKSQPDYYQSLHAHGWQVKIDIGGHQLMGVEADGYYGEDLGVLKIENDKFREIVLQYNKNLTSTWYSIFVSDIIPLSTIIPGYISQCSNPTSTVQGPSIDLTILPNQTSTSWLDAQALIQGCKVGKVDEMDTRGTFQFWDPSGSHVNITLKSGQALALIDPPPSVAALDATIQNVSSTCGVIPITRRGFIRD